MKISHTGVKHFIIIGYSDISVPIADILMREGHDRVTIEDNRNIVSSKNTDTNPSNNSNRGTPYEVFRYQDDLDVFRLDYNSSESRMYSLYKGEPIDKTYILLYRDMHTLTKTLLTLDINIAKGIYISRIVSANDLSTLYNTFGHLFHKTWNEMYYHSNGHRYYNMETLTYYNVGDEDVYDPIVSSIVKGCKSVIESIPTMVRRYVNLNISQQSIVPPEDLLEF